MIYTVANTYSIIVQYNISKFLYPQCLNEVLREGNSVSNRYVSISTTDYCLIACV